MLEQVTSVLILAKEKNVRLRQQKGHSCASIAS
jgi:hypothetical protein